MNNDFLDRIKIVLCRPEGGLNVGSVCRCMQNMGLKRLAIAGDISELNLKHVSDMSIHAKSLFDNAERFDNLEDALQDTVLAAGITRRRGVRRKFFSYLPEELADKAAQYTEGTVALVFGNEQNGLNDRELAACTAACHIPTDPENPSLNLSHAVQIMAYVFFRKSEEKVGRYTPINLEQVDQLSSTVHGVLQDIGYFDKPDRFDTQGYFRDLFARSGMSLKEARHMEKVFMKIRHLKTGSNETES